MVSYKFETNTRYLQATKIHALWFNTFDYPSNPCYKEMDCIPHQIRHYSNMEYLGDTPFARFK